MFMSSRRSDVGQLTRKRLRSAVLWLVRVWQRRGRSVAALALIIVIGAGLRAAFLDRLVRSDDAIIFLRYVSKPLAEIVSTYDQPGNHVLQSAVTRLAYLAFGNRPWALRLPALIAGILIIPATYVWAKDEYGKGAGLLAAALTAASSFLVDYSTRARGSRRVTAS